MNNRIILLALFVLVNSTLVIGQDRQRRHGEISEKLKAQKIAFIVESLELTANESEKFWPIYNEYKSEMKALYMDAHFSSDMTEEEAQKLLADRLDIDRKLIEVKETYNKRLLEVISAKKLVKLSYVDRRFKHNMLKDIKRRYSARRDQE